MDFHLGLQSLSVHVEATLGPATSPGRREESREFSSQERNASFGAGGFLGMIFFLAVNMVISQDQSLTSNPEICCHTCLTWQEMFQMGPKNPDAGMPPRNLPDKPGSFANAWEDSCPMRWRFGPKKTCLVLFESTRLRD